MLVVLELSSVQSNRQAFKAWNFSEKGFQFQDHQVFKLERLEEVKVVTRFP